MIKFNKNAILLITVMILAVLLFAGCGGIINNNGGETVPDTAVVQEEVNVESEPAGELYKGTVTGLLQSVIDEAGAALPEVFIDDITPENAPAILGMLSDDFASFIAEGAAATSESDEVAFQVALVLCRYTDDTEMVVGMIQEGFDPGKWVYVFPDRSLTAVSGPYLMLAAGSEKETQALAAAFDKLSEDPAITTVFYEGETGS